jgi:hypothetical protein
MAMPTVVGVGAAGSTTTTMTLAYPGGYTAVADDIAVSFIETESEAVTPPTNWGPVTNVTVSSGTITRLSAIWRRLTASEASPLIADPGNHMVGQMIILRGCVTTGNPWDIFGTSTELVADSSVSIPGVTTTVANCLILQAFSTGQDVATTTGVTGTWANAALVNVTERMDNWAIAGLGGGFAMASGEKAVAGATGAMTATMTASLAANFKALMTIAFKGATAGPAVRPKQRRQPRQPRTATGRASFSR